MEVEVPGYIQGPADRVPEPVKISNVQATLKEAVDSDRYYVTMGHYDTRVSDPLNWWMTKLVRTTTLPVSLVSGTEKA